MENRKGAASTTIEALPTQTVPSGGLAGAAGERLSCAVCLEEFAEGSELRSLPCLHRFHKVRGVVARADDSLSATLEC